MICNTIKLLLLSVAVVNATSLFSKKEVPPFESLNLSSEKVYNNLILSIEAKRMYLTSKESEMTLEKSGLSKKEYEEMLAKGATEDPQRHLNELATLYQVLNIGDMVMLDKINDLCSANPNEGLLRTQNTKNKPLCFEDPVKLIKMIESRIRAVTSHVLLDPLLSFPEGWYDHVVEVDKILKKLKVEPENMELTMILIEHAIKKDKQTQISGDSISSTLKPKNAIAEVMEAGTILGTRTQSSPSLVSQGSVEQPALNINPSSVQSGSTQPDVQKLAQQIALEILQQNAIQSGQPVPQTLPPFAQQPVPIIQQNNQQPTAQTVQQSIQQPNIQQNPIQPQGPDCGHRIIIDARPTQPDSLTSNIMPGLLNGLMTNV